jgi:ubiquinone/menaquinone biosynthesis C-methylase UbiE
MISSASHKKTNDKCFDLISSHIQGKKDIKILDLGSGRGYLSYRTAELLKKNNLNPKKHLVASDISSAFFEAKEVPFKECDFNKKLPFNDKTFNLIYSVEVIEHLKNPYHFISECYRILKPGGKLIISTPNILQLSSRIRFFLTGFYDLFEPPSIDPNNAGRLCGHIMPLHIAYYDYGLRLTGFSKTKLFIDKHKSLSSLMYFLLFPILRWSFLKTKKRIEKYDQNLYKESLPVLNMMNSYGIYTSRSLIFSSEK